MLNHLKKKSTKIIALLAFISVFLVFVVWLERLVVQSDFFQQMIFSYGYFGIFLASIISGFNVVFPIPMVTFVPIFLASGLSFIPVLVTISLGMTLGDFLGFGLGVLGSKISLSNAERIKNRLLWLRDRYRIGPLVGLFCFVAFTPIPNEVLVVPMGFLGYRLRVIAPILVFGNLVFNSIAYFGFLNVLEIVRPFITTLL